MRTFVRAWGVGWHSVPFIHQPLKSEYHPAVPLEKFVPCSLLHSPVAPIATHALVAASRVGYTYGCEREFVMFPIYLIRLGSAAVSLPSKNSIKRCFATGCVALVALIA